MREEERSIWGEARWRRVEKWLDSESMSKGEEGGDKLKKRDEEKALLN